MPIAPLSDCSISYLDEGQGSPLLFVHGFPLDHTMWKHQIEEFRQTHRVLAVDLPGFGESSAPAAEMSIVGLADRLVEFLDRIGVSTVILCGLSMGGSIALQFALRHPSRLTKMILCDCRAAADAPEAQKMRRDLAERVLKEGPEFVAQAMPARLFAPQTLERLPDVVREVQAVIRSTLPASVASGSLALANREDVIARLNEIETPALVLVGREDVISTVDEMRQIAQHLPHATLAEISGAGHMAPLEAPVEANAAMRQWLVGSRE